MGIKNTSIKVVYYAWNHYTNMAATNDEASHYVRVIQNGLTPATLSSLAAAYPTEIDGTYLPGYYQVDISALENNYDKMCLVVNSSTYYVEVAPVHWDNYIGSTSTQVLTSDLKYINNDAVPVNNLEAAYQTALTELASVPSATPKLTDAILFMYQALRNKTTTTASEKKIHNDAGTATGTATLSDDGTTFEKGEYS